MPMLNPDLLAVMAACPRDYDVLLPESDRPQPMHAIHAPTCLPVIERCIGAGQLRVTGLLEHLDVRRLEGEIVRRYVPAGRSWFNVNTPEDYERAREWLGVGSG
jgi:molybdopterin-guanine dinucleotide biosynthesis protein A